MDNMASVPQTMERRPGLVTFAAIMLFLVAGFQIVWALVEFANALWIRANYGVNGYVAFGSSLWLWGAIDIILAGVAIYAGYDLLRGGRFGQVVGLIIAGVLFTFSHRRSSSQAEVSMSKAATVRLF